MLKRTTVYIRRLLIFELQFHGNLTGSGTYQIWFYVFKCFATGEFRILLLTQTLHLAASHISFRVTMFCVEHLLTEFKRLVIYAEPAKGVRVTLTRTRGWVRVTSSSSAELRQFKENDKNVSFVLFFSSPFYWRELRALYGIIYFILRSNKRTHGDNPSISLFWTEKSRSTIQGKRKQQNNKTGVDLDFRTGLEKLRPKRSASNQPRALQNRQYAQKKYREYKNAEWTRFDVSAEKSKYSVFLGTFISLSSIVVSCCCLVLVHMYGYLRYMSQQLTWAKYRISSQPHVCIRWGPKYRMG